MDACLGVVCLLMCGVPKAVTPIWWEIRVTAMAVPCRGWGARWGVQGGGVQGGGCKVGGARWGGARSMDMCVGSFGCLISGFVNLISGGRVSSTFSGRVSSTSFISLEITV